jgi:hypothetical protein
MINYDLITTDMRDSIIAGSLGFKKVLADASDTDFVFESLPMADVRFKRAVPQATGGNNYWTAMVMEIEIGANDMTGRRASAKIRNDLINALQRHFQVNPRFSASIDTTIVGNVECETIETDDQGAFIASAVLEFHCMVYSQG